MNSSLVDSKYLELNTNVELQSYLLHLDFFW